MTKCPCCGQATDTSDLLVSLDANAASRKGKIVRLEPQSAVLLWTLKKNYPRAVSVDHLLHALNGYQESNAESPIKVLQVRVSLLRDTIKPLGLRITNAYGKTGYRVVLE